MDPAELLRTARWHAGLTQSDIASRAGTSQQAVARYERGSSSPQVGTLVRLVAACGMRLSVALVPQPGLDDAPTRDLLTAAPLDRLPSRYRSPLVALIRALTRADVPHLVAGKAAARLQGAMVKVFDLELWLPIGANQSVLLAALGEAGAFDIDGGRVPLTELELSLAGRPAEAFIDGGEGAVELCLRVMEHFHHQLPRAVVLRLDDVDARLAGPESLPVPWHPRDRDRLSLQRAQRVAREMSADAASSEAAWGAPLQRAPGLEWRYLS